MNEHWEWETASWTDASQGECLGRAAVGYGRPHLYPTPDFLGHPPMDGTSAAEAASTLPLYRSGERACPERSRRAAPPKDKKMFCRLPVQKTGKEKSRIEGTLFKFVWATRLCDPRKLDNSLPGRTVVRISRTCDCSSP